MESRVSRDCWMLRKSGSEARMEVGDIAPRACEMAVRILRAQLQVRRRRMRRQGL